MRTVSPHRETLTFAPFAKDPDPTYFIYIYYKLQIGLENRKQLVQKLNIK